jgi:endonuclease/exonuclease/phosphatase family metal-dependent hydrolase
MTLAGRLDFEVTAAIEAPGRVQRDAMLGRAATPRTHGEIFDSLPLFRQVEFGAPPARDSAAPETLKVAYWNAERCKLLEASAELLAGVAADVVLLAEMDRGMARSGQRHTARELAERLGMGMIFGVEFLEFDLGDTRERTWHAGEHNCEGLHGAAILSRWPMARPALVRLDRDGTWFDGARNGERRVGGRVALAAMLRLGPHDVALVSTHFESHSDPAHRAMQMTVLLDMIERYAAGTAVVIGGDFNTNTLDRDQRFTAEDKRRLLRDDPKRLVDPVRYEPMFELARGRGYDWEACNVADAPTQRQRPDGTPTAPHGKIDWLLTRGLRAASPTLVPAVDRQGTAISDHEVLTVVVGT